MLQQCAQHLSQWTLFKFRYSPRAPRHLHKNQWMTHSIRGLFTVVRGKGILGSWSTLRTGSTPRCSGSGLTNNRGAIRLGYPDGSLALGVLGAECPKRFARLVELVGLLDVDLERPGLEQSWETL
jgi:hypothetical protein